MAGPRDIRKECSMCSRAVRWSRAGLSVFRRSSLGVRGDLCGDCGGLESLGAALGGLWWVCGGKVLGKARYWPDSAKWPLATRLLGIFLFGRHTTAPAPVQCPPPHPHTHKKRHHHHSPRSGVFENEQDRKSPPAVVDFFAIQCSITRYNTM